ncbi:MAG: cupredoxin domain-containing protein [Pseudomonadota bacterium]
MTLVLIPACQAVASEPTQAITLTLGDYHFTPDTIEVTAGQPVKLTLTNTDTITPHNFILKDEATGLNIDTDVSAGKTKAIEFTPTTPGSYTFYCSKKLPFMKSHQEKGMQGTLTVK